MSRSGDDWSRGHSVPVRRASEPDGSGDTGTAKATAMPTATATATGAPTVTTTVTAPSWPTPAGPPMRRVRPGWRSGPRPPWWPEGEPWPPKKERSGKTRFLRRVGCFFGGAIGLMVAAAVLGGLVGKGGPFAGLVVLALVVAVVWMGRALRRTAVPLAEVMSAADRVAQGDYAARVEADARGEVGQLVRTFNTMAARLEADEAQRRALFADVAHEMRTPLAVIRGNVEGMLDGVYPRDDERLETLLDETEIMTRLLDDLRTLSLADAGALSLHPEPTDIAALVDDLLTAFEPRAAAAGIALTGTVAALPPATLDPVRIRQTLDNLLANAIRHTPRGGAVTIDVRPAPGRVLVSVSDTGAGIPPEHLPHVFERFWKSADSGGSGLGLAIARGLVEAHGGEISAESVPGRGTTVRFWLPLRAAA